MGHHHYRHHHTPTYRSRHDSGGVDLGEMFAALFGVTPSRWLGQEDAGESVGWFRSPARERRELLERIAIAKGEEDQLRARQLAEAALNERIEALRGIHRIALQEIPWERYLVQPDPGGDGSAKWQELQTLATRVLAHDELAFSEALAVCGCLVEVHGHVGRDGVRVDLAPTMAHVDLRAPIGDAVPAASADRGALVRTTGERLELYQDYVCGLALRVARELLAVLPLEVVTVDVWNVTAPPPQPEGASGYRDAVVQAPNVRIASMMCARAAMSAIQWNEADASRTVESLPHEMRFDGRTGFYEVPHIGLG